VSASRAQGASGGWSRRRCREKVIEGGGRVRALSEARVPRAWTLGGGTCAPPTAPAGNVCPIDPVHGPLARPVHGRHPPRGARLEGHDPRHVGVPARRHVAPNDVSRGTLVGHD